MMEFHPHAVAYLDILGFSNFVKAAEEDPIKLKQLDMLFNEVIPREISSEGRNSAFPDDMELKCLSCSDSLVISAPISEKSPYPSLVAVSIKAIQIAHAILDIGYLVRGAIAVGNAHRTDSNIFGTGFQDAVEGEKLACNPQIMLTESAEYELNKLKGNPYGTAAFFMKNEVDQIIVDSIYPYPTYLPGTEGDADYYFGKYKNIIINELLECNDARVKEKWLWFARFFNGNVKWFTEHSAFLSDKTLIINDQAINFSFNFLNKPSEDSNWLKSHTAPCFIGRINIPKQSKEES